MKTSLTSLAVAVLALVGASSVFAQAASSPTREQVKKEAAAANKATQGKVPEGQESAAPKKAAPSDKARADVKKEAAAATKTTQGKVPEGQVGTPAKPAPSTTSRAEVKKDAAAAVKAGTTPSGDASTQQKMDEGALKKK